MLAHIDPNIEVMDVDLAGDRRLMLRHVVVKGAQLDADRCERVLQHLADLWTYDVSLVEVDAKDNVFKEYAVGEPHAPWRSPRSVLEPFLMGEGKPHRAIK